MKFYEIFAKEVTVNCTKNPFYDKLTKCVIDDCTSRRCFETTCNVRSDGSLDGPEDCAILADSKFNKLLPKELQEPVRKYQNKKDSFEGSAFYDYDCLYDSDDEELNFNCKTAKISNSPTFVVSTPPPACSLLDLVILTSGSCLGFISIIMLVLCYFKIKNLFCFAQQISNAEREKMLQLS